MVTPRLLLACVTFFWIATSSNAQERFILKGHTGPVLCLAISPKDSMVASGGKDKTIRLWDSHSGKAVASLTGSTDSVRAVAFSPDGTTLAAAGEDRLIRVWNVASGKEVASLNEHANSIVSLSFSPDGTLLSGSWDGTARLWDVKAQKATATLRHSDEKVSQAVFSPDGTKIATGSHDTTIKIWDVATKKELATFGKPGGPIGLITGVAFSPDGKTIASTSFLEGLKIRSVDSGKVVLKITGPQTNHRPLQFCPEGRYLVQANDAIVNLADIEQKKFLPDVKGHTDDVLCAVVSSNGKLLATGSKDKTIRLWDMATLLASKTE